MATKIFDCAVNCGPMRAHAMAQRAANTFGNNLKVDGLLGPKSFAALNSCDPKAWMKAMVTEMTAYYQGIVQKKPSQAVFLNNWLKRAAWVG